MQRPLPITVRPNEAANMLGVSRATFWRWAKERDDFPKLRRLSARCTVVDTAELIAWRDRDIAEVAP